MTDIETKINDLEPCRKELEIVIPFEKMEEELARVYREIGKSRKIRGFRPGKAPRSVLEKFFAPEARDRVIEKQVKSGYFQALRQKELEVVGEPRFDTISWEGEGPLKFKVKVEVPPRLALKNYRGIRLKKPASEVSEEEVDSALEALREQAASFQLVEKKSAEVGDWVELEYRQDKEAGDEWNPAGMVEIKEDEPEGLGFQLVGMEPNEVRKIKLGSEGSAQELDVRFKGLKKKKLPPLDDELAGTWGDYKNLKELKSQIRKDIQARKELVGRRAMENQVQDFLIKKHDIPLPPRVLENMAEEYLKEERAALYRHPSPDNKPSEEDLRAGARKRAKSDLSFMFLLEEIARKEDLKVDPADLAAEISRLAGQKGVDPAELRRRLEAAGKIAVLEERLRRRAALDLLIDNAKIKEGAKL